MIDKVNDKINEELEKVINKKDLSLEDLKLLTEIKATMEFGEKLKNDNVFEKQEFPQEVISDEVICSIR